MFISHFEAVYWYWIHFYCYSSFMSTFVLKFSLYHFSLLYHLSSLSIAITISTTLHLSPQIRAPLISTGLMEISPLHGKLFSFLHLNPMNDQSNLYTNLFLNKFCSIVHCLSSICIFHFSFNFLFFIFHFLI